MQFSPLRSLAVVVGLLGAFLVPSRADAGFSVLGQAVVGHGNIVRHEARTANGAMGYGLLLSFDAELPAELELIANLDGRYSDTGVGSLLQTRAELGLRHFGGQSPVRPFVEGGVGFEMQSYNATFMGPILRAGPGVSLGVGLDVALLRVLLRGTAAAIPGGFKLGEPGSDPEWQVTYAPTNATVSVGAGFTF